MDQIEAVSQFRCKLPSEVHTSSKLPSAKLANNCCQEVATAAGSVILQHHAEVSFRNGSVGLAEPRGTLPGLKYYPNTNTSPMHLYCLDQLLAFRFTKD